MRLRILLWEKERGKSMKLRIMLWERKRGKTYEVEDPVMGKKAWKNV